MRILPEIVRRCGQSAPKYRPLQAAGRSCGAGARSSSRSKGGCSGGITISSVSRGRSDCTRRVIASHFASMSVHFMAQFLLMRGCAPYDAGRKAVSATGRSWTFNRFFVGDKTMVPCPGAAVMLTACMLIIRKFMAVLSSWGCIGSETANPIRWFPASVAIPQAYARIGKSAPSHISFARLAANPSTPPP